MHSITDQVAVWMVDQDGRPLSQRLQDAITLALCEVSEGGWIDSHFVASIVIGQRGIGCDPFQTKDYVQHLLRECYHVCRYADGHHYLAHEAAECGPSCRQHRYRVTVPSRALCPTCFVEVTTQGRCSIGCDDH